jgi:hypothetical protein
MTQLISTLCTTFTTPKDTVDAAQAIIYFVDVTISTKTLVAHTKSVYGDEI